MNEQTQTHVEKPNLQNLGRMNRALERAILTLDGDSIITAIIGITAATLRAVSLCEPNLAEYLRQELHKSELPEHLEIPDLASLIAQLEKTADRREAEGREHEYYRSSAADMRFRLGRLESKKKELN